MKPHAPPTTGGRGECTGRSEESRRLRGAATAASSGRGSTWVVSGEPGIGKTHLLDWLASSLEADGFLVVRESFRGGQEGRLATVDRAFRNLGEAGDSDAGDPRAAASEVARSAPSPLKVLSYVREVQKACQRRPVAILLDDAQHAEPESILAFQVLSRALGGLRGLLVAGLGEQAIGTGPEGDPFWKRTVDLLGSEGTLQRISLKGLDQETCRGIVAHRASAKLVGAEGDEIVGGLYTRAQGNPLFLQELVDLMLSRRGLAVEAGTLKLGQMAPEAEGEAVGGGWGKFPLPPTLRRLVLSRLDHVLPADLRLLQAAALLGGRVEPEVLAGSLGRTQRDVLATLGDLERLGLLHLSPGGPSEGWNFSNDLVWEVVLRDAPPEEVRALAGQLARWWRDSHEGDAETIARLFHDAREPIEGLPAVREAIDLALRSEATEAAERYFRWYFDLLALSPKGAGAGTEEALGLVDRLLVRRLRRETLGVLKALELAGPSEDLAWQLGWREVHVLVSFDLSRAERKLSELEASLESGPHAGDRARRADLAFIRCEVLGARLRFDEAIAAGVEALGLWGTTSGPWERGRILYELSWAHMMLGRLSAAREYLVELLTLTTRAEVPSLRATGLVLDGTLSLMEGNLRAAERSYREAADRLLAIGAMEGYGIARNNQAEVLIHLGDLTAAVAPLEEAELVGRRFGYPRVVQGCSLKWAWLYAYQHRWKKALESLEEAGHGTPGGDFSEEIAEARLLHAWAVGELQNPSEGLVELEWLKVEQAKLQPHVRPSLPRVEGRLLDLAGRPGAREALERSLEAAQRYSGPEEEARAWRAIADWEHSHGGPKASEEAEQHAARLARRGGPVAGRPPLPES